MNPCNWPTTPPGGQKNGKTIIIGQDLREISEKKKKKKR
jgi:hypothetical protein